MFNQRGMQIAERWKVGYAADPAIEVLLNKDLIAQIKIRQLEIHIAQIEQELELFNMQLDMLREEYGKPRR